MVVLLWVYDDAVPCRPPPQNSKRSETPINEYETFSMLVDECSDGVDALDGHRPLAQRWPAMARISHVEFLATQSVAARTTHPKHGVISKSIPQCHWSDSVFPRI